MGKLGPQPVDFFQMAEKKFREADSEKMSSTWGLEIFFKPSSTTWPNLIWHFFFSPYQKKDGKKVFLKQ